jgi:hypothetical protein
MVDEHHITGLFFVAGLVVGLTDANKSAMFFA